MNNLKMNKFNSILKEKRILEFQIYGLKYTIECIDNKYIIYSKLNREFKKEYNSIYSLFKNYKIYGENLIDNDKKIEIK